MYKILTKCWNLLIQFFVL